MWLKVSKEKKLTRKFNFAQRQEVAAKINKLLKQRNLTAAEAFRLMGYRSNSQLYHVLRGYGVLSDDMRHRLAKVLSVDPDELLPS